MTAQEKLPLPSAGWAVIDPGPETTSDPAAVIEFARPYGTVSARDGGAAWAIRPRQEHGTFSQTNVEAPLHTDAQYRDNPEGAFLLACARPAETGGDSIVLRVSDLLESLAARPGREDLLHLLTASIWRWRTPPVFGGPRISAPSPILKFRPDGTPTMRWRLDNLVVDEKCDWAARVVAEAAATHKARRLLRVTAGQILVCDNATVLHGRTAFTDPKRLLWRVRVHP
ncbi:TauD/TfdA family dioxygenase [Nocardia rhizosphaerihabitans]|uniref:TauD/TfdA-like domain-containing protein n=1 Tax=Nocardia rhizosphaerihabitans TaxID=1691570 RepID=A0ABQ2L1I4_9NOCA|nr:TauD/TfdA family dioxygenase [Nocardia rhizosphaerihabitans]GGN99378.1 hypothetical protein GCM10011610_67260 [Nocardia rhizosphaerihabitans]